MYSRIPVRIRSILKALDGYLVGGAVRDLILKGRIKDFDITTPYKPEEVIDILVNRLGYERERLDYVGKHFGVVKLFLDNYEVDIATYRGERYRIPGKPDIYYASTLEEDLKRRDFTINALALSSEGELIDLFNGLEDLRNGVIRFIGDPDKRIDEDPIRMLRALKYAAKYRFKIDRQSLEAIERNSHKIEYIARERIGMEILTAAETKGFHIFLGHLISTCLLNHISPELAAIETVKCSVKEIPEDRHVYEMANYLDTVEASREAKLAIYIHMLDTVSREYGFKPEPWKLFQELGLGRKTYLETYTIHMLSRVYTVEYEEALKKIYKTLVRYRDVNKVAYLLRQARLYREALTGMRYPWLEKQYVKIVNEIAIPKGVDYLDLPPNERSHRMMMGWITNASTLLQKTSTGARNR